MNYVVHKVMSEFDSLMPIKLSNTLNNIKFNFKVVFVST